MAFQRPPVPRGRSFADISRLAAETLSHMQGGYEGDPFQGERHDDAVRAQRGQPPLDRLIPTTEEVDTQDTGWIPVQSTRVKEIRYLPKTQRMFVRFHKYSTAYVYRGATDIQFMEALRFGQAGQGLGGYINTTLDYNPGRDYCSPDEVAEFFGGDGGSYRGPSGMRRNQTA